MKSIGTRLHEERQRLGYTLQEMATAGGVTWQEQRTYERGEDLPLADYLAGIAAQGVDVIYVITGRKNTVVNITHEQAQTLLDNRVVAQELLKNGQPVDDIYFTPGRPSDQS